MTLLIALVFIFLAGLLSQGTIQITHWGQLGHLFPGWLGWGAAIALIAWLIAD